MPVVRASLNSPAGRISLPSASTRQPASDQVLGHLRHPLGRQFQRARIEPRVLGLAEAQLEQLDVGRRLGRGIAADHQAELGRDRQRRGPAGGDDRTVVVELQLAEQLVGRQAPVLPRGAQGQAGRGLAMISSSWSDSTSSRGGTRVSARIRPSIRSCCGSTKVISFS